MGSIKTELIHTITRNDGTQYQVPQSFTTASQKEVEDKTVALAAAASPAWIPIWTPIDWSGYPITSFEHMVIQCEIYGGDEETYAAQFVYIERVCNDGDAAEELWGEKLFVGKSLIVPSSVAYDDHGANVDTNAGLSVLNGLKAKNPETDTNTPDILLRIIMLDDS